MLSLDIEAQLNAVRAGVFQRVRERLLRDAVEVIGRGRTEPEPGHFAHQDLYARSRRGFEPGDEIVQRTDQSAFCWPDRRQSARNRLA